MVIFRCLCFSCAANHDEARGPSVEPSSTIVTSTPSAHLSSSIQEARLPLPSKPSIRRSLIIRPRLPTETPIHFEHASPPRVVLPVPLTRGSDTIITIPPIIEVPAVAPIRIPQYPDKPIMFVQVDVPLPPLESPLSRDVPEPSAPPQEVDFTSLNVHYDDSYLEKNLEVFSGMEEERNRDDTPADQLCKICMNAPLQCVLLDCGHIASCLECGNRLSECPICRQFVARVVKTFKA